MMVETNGAEPQTEDRPDRTGWTATGAGVLGALLAGLAGPDGPLTAGPDAMAQVVAAAVAVHGLAASAASGGGPLTASAVAAPKMPSGFWDRKPQDKRFCCSSATGGPLMPSAIGVGSGVGTGVGVGLGVISGAAGVSV